MREFRSDGYSWKMRANSKEKYVERRKYDEIVIKIRETGVGGI